GRWEKVPEIQGNIGSVHGSVAEIYRRVSVAVIIHLGDHDFAEGSVERGAEIEDSAFRGAVLHPKISEHRSADPGGLEGSEIVNLLYGSHIAGEEIGRGAQGHIGVHVFA